MLHTEPMTDTLNIPIHWHETSGGGWKASVGVYQLRAYEAAGKLWATLNLRTKRIDWPESMQDRETEHVPSLEEGKRVATAMLCEHLGATVC